MKMCLIWLVPCRHKHFIIKNSLCYTQTFMKRISVSDPRSVLWRPLCKPCCGSASGHSPCACTAEGPLPAGLPQCEKRFEGWPEDGAVSKTPEGDCRVTALRGS